MPIFLNQDQVYRLLQREAPEDDVYPDGSPDVFFSTADQSSVAKTVGDAYANLANIYKNYYPISAEESLADHEFEYFGYTLDGSLSLDDRRARLLSKIRTRRRTTEDDMVAAAYTVLDPSILVEVAPWGCGEAGWMLDVSQLDIETILNEFNGLERTGPGLCALTAADYGFTDEEFADLQNQAYTYEVRIYGHVLTANERADLERVLTAGEPARSRHIIIDGLDPADAIGGDT